jgi:hypothetical protein
VTQKFIRHKITEKIGNRGKSKVLETLLKDNKQDLDCQNIFTIQHLDKT